MSITSRATPAALGLLALACYALTAVPAIHSGMNGFSPSFQDDAYYYFVTANHFLRSGVFAFDGVNATNGFHPLWMAIVVALFKTCGACTPAQQIFAVKLAETLLRGLAVALCVGFYAADPDPRRAIGLGYLGIALVLLCPAFTIFEQGMETTLAALLLVLAIRAFMSGNAIGLGAWLALLFLARLDTAVFVAAPILLGQLVIEPRRPARLLAMALPVATVFALYTGYNLWHTGHAVPISGALRSSFPVLTWHGSYLIEPLNITALYGWRMLVSANMLVLLAVLVFGFALFAFARPPRAVRGRLLVVGIVGAWLFANLLLFQRWEKSIDPRYLALPLVAGAFFLTGAAALAGERLAAGGSRGAAVVPAGAVALLLVFEGAVFTERFAAAYRQASDPLVALFGRIRALVPEQGVIAGTDVGALAFWTGRRVVNLDGVINNYAYQDYLRDGRLHEYLREQGVGYIATPLADHAPTYTGRRTEPMYEHLIDAVATRGTDYAQHDYYVYSYLYHVYSDRIALTPAQEILRQPLGRSGEANLTYVIYRLER